MHINQRFLVRAGAAAFAAALLVLPQPASAAGSSPPAPVCQLSRLPVPEGVTASQVLGGDHTGRHLIGTGVVSDGTTTAYVPLHWTNGRVRIVDTSAIRPYVSAWVTDVNSHGVVVGTRITDTSLMHTDGWVYRAGRATLLPPLHPGDYVQTAAINAHGDIVGTSGAMVDDVWRTWAVLWPANRPGTVRELVVTGESPRVVSGVDIDDDGTVLGFIGMRPTPDQHPYVWPARGTGYALTGLVSNDWPEAAAVHNGQVVGAVLQSEGGIGYSYAVRWNLPTITPELVSTKPSGGNAVNRQGVIASGDTLIYPDGSELTLGGFVTVLSDHHTAAGYSMDNAVVWTRC